MLYQLSYSRIGDRAPEPYPPPGKERLSVGPVKEWWGEQDSNLRSCEAADLQSAPVGHLGISPLPIHGANGRIRTPDLLITNQLLYQLSYIGLYNRKRTPFLPLPDQEVPNWACKCSKNTHATKRRSHDFRRGSSIDPRDPGDRWLK
jgi:hypothetical protein